MIPITEFKGRDVAVFGLARTGLAAARALAAGGARVHAWDDNDVTRAMDEKRMAWHMGDIIENRPALSRWHPDYKDAFAAFMAKD